MRPSDSPLCVFITASKKSKLHFARCTVNSTKYTMSAQCSWFNGFFQICFTIGALRFATMATLHLRALQKIKTLLMSVSWCLMRFLLGIFCFITSSLLGMSVCLFLSCIFEELFHFNHPMEFFHNRKTVRMSQSTLTWKKQMISQQISCHSRKIHTLYILC